MTCFHCGAQLNSNDIFCSKCKTPVLTEDDAALANFNRALQESGLTQFNSAARIAGSLPEPFNSYPEKTTRTPDPLPEPFNSYPTSVPRPKTKMRGETRGEAQSEIRDEIRGKSEPPAKADKFADKFADEFSFEFAEESVEEKTGYTGSRLKLILITIFVFLAVLVAAFYFLIIHPTGAPIPRPGSTGGISTGDTGTPQGDASAGSSSSTGGMGTGSSAVSSIKLTDDGREQSEFHVRINETIVLQARLGPEGADAEVTWASGDPEILDVVQTGSGGRDARITGRAAGVVDIIVSAGGIEANYPIFVDDFPLHVQLADAIEYTTTTIWITILWMTGPDADYETLLIRDPDSRQWVMEDFSSGIDVSPVFNFENKSFVIEIPATDMSFYLFNDMTGHSQNSDGTNSEDFIWWFSTIHIEPEG